MVLGRRVVAGKEPVLTAEGHPFERSLAGVVVDVEVALRGIRGPTLRLTTVELSLPKAAWR